MSWTAIALPILLFATWSAEVYAAALGKLARGERGGVSVLPGIPVCPLAAWWVASLLDRASPELGTWMIGGGHALFLVALCVSIARSRGELARRLPPTARLLPQRRN